MDERKKTPVEEVREIRHRIAEECGNDIRRIKEHAKATMQALGLHTVSVI